MLTNEIDTTAANAIGLMAIARFKRRCEENKDFVTNPKVVMQSLYDQIAIELSPERVSWQARQGNRGERQL